jgi:hypothetical protein
VLALAQPPLPPPPQPPPLAFRAAELHRAAHAIDVEVLSVVEHLPLRVRVARNGTRLGRGVEATVRGSTFVRVRLGPKALKPLHPGLHVTVLIDYGSREPLRARAALVAPPPGQDVDDDVGPSA